MNRSKLSKRVQKILGLLEAGLAQAQEVAIERVDVYSGKTVKIKPFFISLSAVMPTSTEIRVNNGALFHKTIKNVPGAYAIRADIRVGDYERGCNTDTGFFLAFPNDLDTYAFKRLIWRYAKESIYGAQEDLDARLVRSSKIRDEADKAYSFFSKESPIEWYKVKANPKVDFDLWEDIMKRVSLIFSCDEIIDSSVHLNYEFSERYLVNSEGTRIVDTTVEARLDIDACIADAEGVIYDVSRNIYELDIKQLPDENGLRAICEDMIRELHEIKNAPLQEAGLYPTILRGSLPGAFIHEPFHAVEAHRQINEDSDGEEELGCDKSLTFKNKTGEDVAPSFLTIVDDPTKENRFGSYGPDAEGVVGQRVPVIENGKLVNLLHSRNSAGRMSKFLKKNVKSNGHCRQGSIFDDGEPRMSNLIGVSSKYWSKDELVEMLVKRCKKLGLPYGLIGEDFIAGENLLPKNVFHVVPKRLYRLYVKDGRMELVKGAFITSTPLRALREIKAVGLPDGFVNCVCGSSSGMVPVSFEMPEMFLNTLEFAEVDKSFYGRLAEKLPKPPMRVG